MKKVQTLIRLIKNLQTLTKQNEKHRLARPLLKLFLYRSLAPFWLLFVSTVIDVCIDRWLVFVWIADSVSGGRRGGAGAEGRRRGGGGGGAAEEEEKKNKNKKKEEEQLRQKSNNPNLKGGELN